MSKKLNRSQTRKLLFRELNNIGEDVLVTKSKTGTPPLGTSIRKGHVKVHDCPSCNNTMDMCKCGYMDESDCSECGSTMYECSCMNSKMSDSTDSEGYEDIISSILNMNNEHSTDGHQGAYMSKSQLYKIAKYSEKLYGLIPDGHNLEDWMRTKISQISDDISEVYHALDHDKFKGEL